MEAIGAPVQKNRPGGLRAVYDNDSEMFDFVVGLLFYWKP